MRITLEVCDVCKDKNRETQPYSIRRDGGKMQRIVLCSEHGKPIEALLEAEPAAQPARRSPVTPARKRTSRGRTRHASSIAEIEASKTRTKTA